MHSNPSIPEALAEARPARRNASERSPEVRIFVIFDTAHDADLFERFDAQSKRRRRGVVFSVIGGSESADLTAAGRNRLRRKLREADQTVVLCGEHTEDSPAIHGELQIAKEEKKPYILLWGRRGVPCTKPLGASPKEGMYSWTEEILNDQITLHRRQATTQVVARSMRRVPTPGV